jgi:hypothetical protein
MTIDLERLAVDADYWDEVAPEGATHFMYSEKFVKWVDGVEWAFYTSSDKAWKQATLTWPLQKYTDNGNEVVAKPTKPAAQEWDGKGLPPVGIICDVWHLKKTWRRAGIVAYVISVEGEKAVWQLVDYSEWGGDLACNFRPIRSQAERDRKELATFLEDYHLEMGSYWCPEKEADYILSSYDVAKKARGEL